jgi:hypothetical protein
MATCSAALAARRSAAPAGTRWAGPPARRRAGPTARVHVTAAVAVLGLIVGLVACGRGGRAPRDGLAPDTARFSYGERSVEVPLADCGREDDVVLLGGTHAGVVLQAAADLGEGGIDRTGVTVDLGEDGIWGAFGADLEQGPAGEITDVRAEGDRLIVEATWVPFDDEIRAQPPPGGHGLDGRLVARCPDGDDEVAAAH